MTETQLLVGGFALVLTNILALAAFLDNRWRKAAPLRDLSEEDESNFSLQSSGDHNGKNGQSYLETRYADLSASGLGTAEQQITFRGKTAQSPEGD